VAKTRIELLQFIECLRRAQPRNPHVNIVCDSLESLLAPTVSNPLAAVVSSEDANKAARRLYMRDLMRTRRAAAKAVPAAPATS
jgi:hypothetical protein